MNNAQRKAIDRIIGNLDETDGLLPIIRGWLCGPVVQTEATKSAATPAPTPAPTPEPTFEPTPECESIPDPIGRHCPMPHSSACTTCAHWRPNHPCTLAPHPSDACTSESYQETKHFPCSHCDDCKHFRPNHNDCWRGEAQNLPGAIHCRLFEAYGAFGDDTTRIAHELIDAFRFITRWETPVPVPTPVPTPENPTRALWDSRGATKQSDGSVGFACGAVWPRTFARAVYKLAVGEPLFSELLEATDTIVWLWPVLERCGVWRNASPRARTRARIKTLADAGLVVATWHGSAVEVRLS
jgi:hypothetical protein